MVHDLYPPAPPGAPAWVPSPEQEKAIHAFAQCPLDDRLIVLMLEGSRGEGKTTTAIVAQMVLAEAIVQAGLGEALPYRSACVRDTWANLSRALSVDAPVLSPSGWVKSGDVSVGDFLIGANGCPTRVLGVYPQGDRPLWRVRFSDGTAAHVTGDHLWMVTTKHYRNGHGKPRSGSGGKPYKPHRIVTTEEVRERLRRSGCTRWSIPLVDPVQFPSHPVPLDPYVLGVLLGDGCFTPPSVRLTTTDKAIAEAIAMSLPAGVSLRYQERYAYVLKRDARYGPNLVMQSIRELGLIRHRAWEKFVPAIYLWNTATVRHAVLQGLLDTDGHAASGRILFTTTSRRLAEDVMFLSQSLGGTAKIRVHVRRSNRESYRVVIRLPISVKPFRLARKVIVAEQSANPRNKPRRFIVAVESAGRGPSVCFKVADPSGLFVMNDFIVTHNTTIQTFRELAHLGLPVRLVNQDHEALIEGRDGKVTNHFFFFGLDRPADADRLQGFSCGCLWIEEAAPAADFATGVPPESLGIGATSVRQEGMPRRILLTQNPPDEDHWTVKIGKYLVESGLEDAHFERLSLSPGGKAQHFRAMAEEAPGAIERQRWERAAERFESYRRTSRALLEAAGRGDLVRRLIEGERGGVQVGEPVVPNFSKKLHVVPHLEFLPGVPIIRGWDTDLHPATCFLQVLPNGAGVNIVAARRSTNLGMTQHIRAEVLPFQDLRGLKAWREGTGNIWRAGAGGGWKFRDIGDPAGKRRDSGDSDRSARLAVEKMLGTRYEFGPESWPSRRDALHAAFERRGRGDRMWVQIAEDECEELIWALSGRARYPINPATGRIIGTVEAMKRESGLYTHSLDALAYVLAKLYPAHEWLRAASTLPAPRVPPPKRTWMEV